MEAKYGRERLDDLEASAASRKWTRPELEELKVYYKDGIKRLERGEFPPESDNGVAVLDMFKSMGDSG